MVELRLRKTPFQKGPGVDTRGGVSLKVNLVPRAAVILAAEEVVKTHFVQRGRRSVGGDVSSNTVVDHVGPGYHDRRVPANQAADALLDPLISREQGLFFRRDRIDVRSLNELGNPNVQHSGSIEDSLKEILTAHTPVAADQRLQGLNPLAGLLRIHISNLLNQFSAHRSYLIETIYHRSSGALWEVPEDSGQWSVASWRKTKPLATDH